MQVEGRRRRVGGHTGEIQTEHVRQVCTEIEGRGELNHV